MRVLTIVATLIMATTSSAEEFRLHPEVRDGIRAAIERGDMRAAVIGLYDGGELETIVFGHVSRADDGMPDDDTAFEIGSVTKVFTALLAQAQVEAGRMGWDDTIGEHLPDAEFASSAVAGVTLRELATHTSGLPRIPDNMDPEDPLNPYEGYEDDDLLAFLTGMEAESLDKAYAYSNLGAGLLGHVAAKVAGASYAGAMTRDVLAPLGLDDTAVGLPAELERRMAPGFSQGADVPNWSGFDALAGAGAIVSTAGDMLRFIRVNLEAGDSASSGESAAAGARSRLAAIREPQENGETGLGWHLHDIADGDPVYWHNGGTGGYASFLAIRPAKRTGAVLLTTSTEYAEVTDLGFVQMGVSDRSEATVDLAPYLGSYRLEENFVLTVFEESGRLYGQATGQAAFPLTEKGPDEFEFATADIRIVFDRSSPGPAQALTLYQGERTTEAPRVSDAEGPQPRRVIPVDAGTLEDYAGRYRLTPEIVITVMVRNGQLFAQLTGQQAFPVFPYDTDRFFYKVVDAQLAFERDDQGTVDAVVLHQNGEQRAPRIE